MPWVIRDALLLFVLFAGRVLPPLPPQLACCLLSHSYEGGSAPLGWRLHYDLDSESSSLELVQQNVIHNGLLHGELVLHVDFVEHVVDHLLDEVIRDHVLVYLKHHPREDMLAPLLLEHSQHSVWDFVSAVLLVPLIRLRLSLQFRDW